MLIPFAWACKLKNFNIRKRKSSNLSAQPQCHQVVRNWQCSWPILKHYHQCVASMAVECSQCDRILCGIGSHSLDELNLSLSPEQVSRNRMLYVKVHVSRTGNVSKISEHPKVRVRWKESRLKNLFANTVAERMRSRLFVHLLHRVKITNCTLNRKSFHLLRQRATNDLVRIEIKFLCH